MTTQFFENAFPAFLTAFYMALVYSDIIREKYKLSFGKTLIVYIGLHIVIFIPSYFLSAFFIWAGLA